METAIIIINVEYNSLTNDLKLVFKIFLDYVLYGTLVCQFLLFTGININLSTLSEQKHSISFYLNNQEPSDDVNLAIFLGLFFFFIVNTFISKKPGMTLLDCIILLSFVFFKQATLTPLLSPFTWPPHHL